MNAGDRVIVINSVGVHPTIAKNQIYTVRSVSGSALDPCGVMVTLQQIPGDTLFMSSRFRVIEDKEASSQAKKNDDGKTQYDILLSINGLHRVANCFSIGAKKYEDPFNFRKGDEKFKKRLVSATIRHVIEYLKGNKLDPEDNESHIAHAISNLMMILDLEEK